MPQNRTYEYRTVKVPTNGWPGLTGRIKVEGAADVEAASGHFYGLWLGHIGLGANEVIVVTDWPDEAAARESGGLAVAFDSNIETLSVELLSPTVRPTDNTPPAAEGIYAHRWFDVAAEDWPEFLELSEEAWPNMEAVFECEIKGFWRRLSEKPGWAEVLLMTWYRDLSVWEASRFWGKSPNPDADKAMDRFRRRRQLTLDTIVRTTTLG